MPDSGIEALGLLTQLQCLHLDVPGVRFGLLHLQPLTACSRLTELFVPELAVGYAEHVEQIDNGGTQLSSGENMAVAAAARAAAAVAVACQAQQQQQQVQDDDDNDDDAAGDVQWQQEQRGSGSGGAGGSSGAAAVRSAMAAAAAGSTGATSTPCSPSAAVGGVFGEPQVVQLGGGKHVQVPLLPQLQVLSTRTLWWRLPLAVVSVRLRHVMYKRLRNTGFGTYVMPDMSQVQQAQVAEQQLLVEQQMLAQFAVRHVACCRVGCCCLVWVPTVCCSSSAC